MRCGYFDTFSGAAGDMILSALVDAGAPFDLLRDLPDRLKLPEASVRCERTHRAGLAATRVSVHIAPDSRPPHRHLSNILQIISTAGLSPATTERASDIFRRLAEAEATAHGIEIEKVHFHEVGAADAIIDIVGACLGIESLELQRITCSPIPVGSGTAHCEHGELPVPTPATAMLLRGVPLANCALTGEMTTPTGAAILTTLADDFTPLPPMRIDAIGHGAGTREIPNRANILRLFVGESAVNADERLETIAILETQLDDATPQALAHACQQLLGAGALDAFITPIVMKKGRPGHLLSALCRPEDVSTLEDILFAETPTLGIRRRLCERRALPREHVTVQTPFGEIRVKLARQQREILQASPEYEDCAAAAARHGVALHRVQEAALEAYARLRQDDG
jgi:uncharacterized protein (TIGR00299 family) protein